MIQKFKLWLIKWLGIDQAFANQNMEIRRYKQKLDDTLIDLDRLTAFDADVGVRGRCSVILTGVYRGRGFVQFYDVHPHEFHRLVEMYRDMERTHLIRNVDNLPGFRGTFDINF